jgi:hypothetical protein
MGKYPAFLTVDLDISVQQTAQCNQFNSRRYSSSAAYAGPVGGWSGEKAQLGQTVTFTSTCSLSLCRIAAVLCRPVALLRACT